MGLNIGDTVPDFTATDDNGDPVRLSEFTDQGPVVLFFYPKAFTGGCTQEACHFRDLAAEFAEVGATRLGISRDDADTQHRFVEEHGFDYPLLSDPDGEIAKIFGAKRLGPLWSKRHTFVIDSERRLVDAIRSETDMELHADQALETLHRISVG